MERIRNKQLGVVTGGSLNGGLTARLNATVSTEDIRVGNFVVVQGKQNAYLCMIGDVMLDTVNSEVLASPPLGDPFTQQILAGTTTYAKLALSPRLMLPAGGGTEPLPPKTIPPHFTTVYEADEADFVRVFGGEAPHRFEIGTPLDMEVPIRLDLRKFVERSNGVFGKSGTGKSFLTRLLLCGTIAADVCSNLVFDMHSEYGWDSKTEANQNTVKGLRQLFGSRVAVYMLGDARGRKVDGSIVIGLNQIEVADVETLQEQLGLSQAAIDSCYLLYERYKERWLIELRTMDSDAIEAFARSSGAHGGSISALRRKLAQLSRFSFVQDRADFSVVDQMVQALQRRQHVVLDFSGYDDLTAYMLVTNLLTRRIYRTWRDETERALAAGNNAALPPPLMLTLEEAHRFLTPSVARQTIFGTIAREMRKYGVTLLVVDQRPSSIDPEVMSQLGTRITALLNDERDIDAVFSGVSGERALKTVLATLESRQQAMLLGHAVPMPVVVRTRSYDADFYRALQAQPQPTGTGGGGGSPQGGGGSPRGSRSAEGSIDELFPE